MEWYEERRKGANNGYSNVDPQATATSREHRSCILPRRCCTWPSRRLRPRSRTPGKFSIGAQGGGNDSQQVQSRAPIATTAATAADADALLQLLRQLLLVPLLPQLLICYCIKSLLILEQVLLVLL